MSDERSKAFESFDEDPRNLPLLDAFDRVIASLPPGDPVRRELLDLRPKISDHEATIVEARHMIEQPEEVIKKITSAANRIGTFLGATPAVTTNIAVGPADYYCDSTPLSSLARLASRTR